MKRTFLSLGMARSGQHAMIDWVCSQFPGEIIHYNHCVLGWDKRRLIPRNNKYTLGTFINDGEDDAIFYSIEEQSPHDLYNNNIFSFPEVVNPIFILFLRDPLNWLASMLRFLRIPKVKRSQNILIDNFLTDAGIMKEWGLCSIYIDHIKEAIGTTHYFPHPFVVISFNRWFASRDYRDKVSDLLGISRGDKAINRVRYGIGSSLEAKKYDHNAQDMPVLERYHSYVDDDFFMDIVDTFGFKKLTDMYFS